MSPFRVTSTKTHLACTEYMLGNTSRASHRQTNTKYWSVLSALLGENATMHFSDSPHISMGVLTCKCEISERVLFQVTFGLQLIPQLQTQFYEDWCRWTRYTQICVVNVFRYIDSNYKHFAKNMPFKSYVDHNYVPSTAAKVKAKKKELMRKIYKIFIWTPCRLSLRIIGTATIFPLSQKITQR